MPFAGEAGRCASVPTGTVAAPVALSWGTKLTAFNVAIVPSPRLVRAADAVFAPVPPATTGRGVLASDARSANVAL